MGEMLAARDVAGLSTDPEARSVGVDLEALVGASDRLGCDPATVRSLLPRLRSAGFPGGARAAAAAAPAAPGEPVSGSPSGTRP
ncbi:MAG: hypothetical protein DWQ30_05890 [Acidobacteria bacterium]|nr:MAG: hypothetical protein DWQ30_05890 [Acidobacteriota bacterium]